MFSTKFSLVAMLETFLCFEDKPDYDETIFVPEDMQLFLNMARELVPEAMRIRDELPQFQFGPRPSTSVLSEKD